MGFTQKYYFFQCYHCGQWYYTNKIIKIKKCINCNHSFQFQKSSKFSKTCFLNDAIAIIKQLKGKNKEQNLSKYFENKFADLDKINIK